MGFSKILDKKAIKIIKFEYLLNRFLVDGQNILMLQPSTEMLFPNNLVNKQKQCV